LSSAEVASSSIKISGLRKKILAMLSLCFSHPESFNHLSPMVVSSHNSVLNTKSAFAFFKAIIISSSLASFFAKSIFSLIVTLKSELS
jgi:hypothetical protein